VVAVPTTRFHIHKFYILRATAEAKGNETSCTVQVVQGLDWQRLYVCIYIYIYIYIYIVNGFKHWKCVSSPRRNMYVCAYVQPTKLVTYDKSWTHTLFIDGAPVLTDRSAPYTEWDWSEPQEGLDRQTQRLTTDIPNLTSTLTPT
jgi:hypothetical protein